MTRGISQCSQCGAPVAGDRLAGVCPACLLRAGLGGASADSVLGTDDALLDLADSSIGDAGVTLPARAVHAGARIGPFTVLGDLGQGGMGVVFRARHDDGRVVALKLLHEIPRSSTHARRFVRECRVLEDVDHPHVVRFVAAGSDPAWLAMEFVEGRDLSDILQGGPLEPEEARRILAEVAEATAYLHSRGLLHRDLKPANILIRDSDQRALVTDFGLVRQVDGSRFTASGAFLGTLAYASPEQAAGKKSEVGAPADVWALGAILYNCLTGDLPFKAESFIALAVQIMEGPIPTLPPGSPPDLRATLGACLQRDPARRPTAREVAEALRGKSANKLRAPRAPGWLALLVGAGLVSALALALALALRMQPRGVDDGSGAPAANGAAPTPLPVAAFPSAAKLPGWTATWELGGARADTPAPALWDEPGRIAAPLDRALNDEEGALASAFWGEAEGLRGDRVSVSYTMLGRALFPEVVVPGQFVCGSRPPSGELRQTPSGATFLAANDSGFYFLRVGEAWWSGPRARLRARRVEKIDVEHVALRLGEAQLWWHGRRQQLGGLGAPSTPFTFLEGWHELTLAPGAKVGKRVLFDDRTLPTFDSAAAADLGPSQVHLSIFEAHLELGAIHVEGRPLRTDEPALAFAPGALSSAARVAASFAWDPTADARGGPLVGLGDGAALGIWLELLADRFVIRIGRAVVGELTLDLPAPSEGVLLLEREAEEVRAVLRAGDREQELRIVLPLPLWVPPTRAAYGSTAARVQFVRVEVASGADDAQRTEIDGALARTGALTETVARLESRDDPRSLWRLGALQVASVSDPAWVAPDLRGKAGEAIRRELAARGGERLERAAGRLAGRLRFDALSRATLGWVVAGQGLRAVSVAQRLVQEAGQEEARALFDGLLRSGGRPVLLDSLLSRGAGIQGLDVREAGLRVAGVFASERSPEIAAGLGSVIRLRGSANTAEGRADLERALVLYEQGDVDGVPLETRNAARNGRAEILMELGRYAEALPIWSRAAKESRRFFEWSQLASCQERVAQEQAALESSLVALSLARQQPSAQQAVVRLTSRLARRGEHDGLVACALLVLSRVNPTLIPGAKERARQLAQTVVPGPYDDSHLAHYVLACFGDTSVTMISARAPLAFLARARAGAPGDRKALARVAQESILMHSLALLDPELGPLVTRK